MSQVKLYCKKIKDAEKHQAKLYEQYNSVELIQFPPTGESGTYIWKVADEIKSKMNPALAVLIIKNARRDFKVEKLIRVIGRRGTSDCIELKEKRCSSTSEQTAIDNFHAVVRRAGLTFTGLGIGFDANANEYTIGYKW
jgi:hypothetical protein